MTDSGLGDVSGVLLRPIIETWLVALYVLYGGPDAIEHIGGAHVAQVRLLPEDFVEHKEAASFWDRPYGQINCEDLSRTVGGLLEREGGVGSR